jgi:hypothetical protein
MILLTGTSLIRKLLKTSNIYDILRCFTFFWLSDVWFRSRGVFFLLHLYYNQCLRSAFDRLRIANADLDQEENNSTHAEKLMAG